MTKQKKTSQTVRNNIMMHVEIYAKTMQMTIHPSEKMMFAEKKMKKKKAQPEQ